MNEYEPGSIHTYLMQMGDYRQEDPLARMNMDMLRTRIAGVLEMLDYREREILRLRYGLTDGCTYTLEEIGRVFSITRERVRQIESEAIRKLQRPGPSRKLAGFLDRPMPLRHLKPVPAGAPWSGVSEVGPAFQPDIQDWGT